MTWLWPYLFGVLTLPMLAMLYGIGLGVRKSWTTVDGRRGIVVLVFGAALLAVVFLAGMNFTAWREALGW